MEWKFIIPPLIGFIMSLVAFVPMSRYRQNKSEEKDKEQDAKLQAQTAMFAIQKEAMWDLEKQILENENKAIADAVLKVAEALMVTSESNTICKAMVESQNTTIDKVHQTAERAHYRLDDHIENNNNQFVELRKEIHSRRD